MTLLQIQELSCSYQTEPVLHDISFSLDRGEILCLLGPSGSGKTTLLRQLAGLDSMDQGRILFDGQDMATLQSHKRNFGMMFQEYALFPHKNVADNVGFGLEMQKWNREKKAQRVTEMLELVGLHGFDNRSVAELSGGERQRVALARSLAPQPQLLLLDEPLGSLDRILRDRLAGEIRSILKSQEITAVFVTHDQSEAFAVADKIGILQQGRLIQFDTPETVYRTPDSAAVARFLGFRNIIDFSSNMTPKIDSLFSNLSEDFQAAATAQLLIRPESAILSQGSSDTSGFPLLHGRITKRQFQGHSYQLLVKVENLQLSLNLPIDPLPPQSGEQVHLVINPGAMVWLQNRGEQ